MTARVVPSTAAEGGGIAKTVGVLRFGFGKKLGFGNGIGGVRKRIVEDSGEEHAMFFSSSLSPLFSRPAGTSQETRDFSVRRVLSGIVVRNPG